MKCPIDNADLVMAERQGIEIDYCPKCRGVWLDRGELDKIIERASANAPQQPASFTPSQPQSNPPSHPQHSYDPRPGYDPRHDPRHQKHYKRKSFLGELFDFD
jgi:Zn-finger nucleic acid-binding protein